MTPKREPKREHSAKELYLNIYDQTFSITNEKNELISLEHAKHLIDTRRVKTWNLAFGRLMDFGYDLARLKEYYKGRREV